jgi:hypothetical protein
MMALTLWRPWPFAIQFLGKDIENRTWPAPKHLLKPGDLFAIHAGRSFDREALRFLLERQKQHPVPRGEAEHKTGIVCVVRYLGTCETSRSPWFFGPVGWVIRLEFDLPTPVLCSGQQGLWKVPAAVEKQIHEQMMPVSTRKAVTT